NDKYFYFGKFPARFDDILNFIPARISFYLIIFSCFFIKECDYKNAYAIGKKYRSSHASPNSAWAEAPYAGALNIKLAGPFCYGSFFCDYPYLGECSLYADPASLKTALKMFQYSIFSSLIFYTFLLFLGKQ
ncbi:MAG: cobalamin biosynthesis protein, partial [Mailhella sp.]|nr:cobalamin biosynthesis protein [Mailhella sp.]